MECGTAATDGCARDAAHSAAGTHGPRFRLPAKQKGACAAGGKEKADSALSRRWPTLRGASWAAPVMPAPPKRSGPGPPSDWGANHAHPLIGRRQEPEPPPLALGGPGPGHGRRRPDGAAAPQRHVEDSDSRPAVGLPSGQSRGALEGLPWIIIAAMGVAAIAYVGRGVAIAITYVGRGVQEAAHALSAPEGGIQRAMRAIDGPVQGAARDFNNPDGPYHAVARSVTDPHGAVPLSRAGG